MGKRPILSFLLLSLMAVLSCSNVPVTSSIIGNSLFQLSEKLNFNRNDYDALFPPKRVLLASGALIKNKQSLAVSELTESLNEDPAVESQKEESAVPEKNGSLVFGGAAYLLIGKV